MRSHVNSAFVSISSSGSCPMVEMKKGRNTTGISTIWSAINFLMQDMYDCM